MSPLTPENLDRAREMLQRCPSPNSRDVRRRSSLHGPVILESCITQVNKIKISSKHSEPHVAGAAIRESCNYSSSSFVQARHSASSCHLHRHFLSLEHCRLYPGHTSLLVQRCRLQCRRSHARQSFPLMSTPYTWRSSYVRHLRPELWLRV